MRVMVVLDGAATFVCECGNRVRVCLYDMGDDDRWVHNNTDVTVTCGKCGEEMWKVGE